MKKIYSLFSVFLGLFCYIHYACAEYAEEPISFADRIVNFFILVALFAPFMLWLLVDTIILCFIFFGFAFWIYMIIDAIKNEKDNDRIVWILILIFLHALGALIYYFVRKRPRKKEVLAPPMPQAKSNEDTVQ